MKDEEKSGGLFNSEAENTAHRCVKCICATKVTHASRCSFILFRNN